VSARRLRFTVGTLLAGLAVFSASNARAGPPFVTDDPVPTDYRNWEIYTGLTYANEGHGTVSAALPFAEFNYGALPNVQVSVSLPLQSDVSPEARRYGYGATAFGIKTRFVEESDDRPQVSFYPSVEIPSTGGHIVTLLPLWLQKSSSRWTAFGGGGLYLNAGPGERNYTFVGGALERSLSAATTIGAEVYRQGPSTPGALGVTAANVGLTARLGDFHAILFSFGRALQNSDTFSGYASYEFELGPRSAK